MVIASLTDIHGEFARIGVMAEELRRADAVFLAGDLTQFGGHEDVARVVEAVRGVNPRVWAVPGNCDPVAVGQWLSEEGINLDRAVVAIGELSVVGLGGSLPCPGRTPNEFSDVQLEQRLGEIAGVLGDDRPDVFVTHEPPLNTINDLANNGRHVGSRAVREFIEEYQPLVCLTGHIHEGCGIDTIGHTKVVNPGPMRLGGYARVEIEGGVAAAAIH